MKIKETFHLQRTRDGIVPVHEESDARRLDVRLIEAHGLHLSTFAQFHIEENGRGLILIDSDQVVRAWERLKSGSTGEPIPLEYRSASLFPLEGANLEDRPADRLSQMIAALLVSYDPETECVVLVSSSDGFYRLYLVEPEIVRPKDIRDKGSDSIFN